MKRCLLPILTLLFFPLATLASGQTVVRPGEPVKITAETGLLEPSFTWIIYQEEREIDTRSGQEFAYTFADAGQYTVVLLAEEEGGRAERSVVEVLVTAEAGSLQPLKAVLDSLPAALAQGNAPVPRNRPVAVLYAARSEGDIVEYRIDFDIAADSDGDGDPGNDRDNSGHESLQNGAAWGVDLKSIEKPVTVRLTVFDRQGNQSSQDLTFVEDLRGNTQKPLGARIASLPPSDATGSLHLDGETAVAVFGFSDSEGSVGRYEFDRNIAIDTDGDGNPGNDIDNRLHPSLTAFEPLQVTFRRAEGLEQIVQLTVIDKQGRQGSRIRRKVVFDAPGLATPPPADSGLEWKPRLLADHTRVPAGQPTMFYLMGIPRGASLSWDFNGDGAEDKSGTESTAQWIFAAPGDYTASVRITAVGKTMTATETLTVMAPDADGEGLAAPTADFSYASSADGFRFTNLSLPDPRLQERQLTFEWNFGDGTLSADANPTHLYAAPGVYIVSLRVTDAAGKSAEKAVTLEAAVGAGALDGAAASPQASTGTGDPAPQATLSPTDAEGGSVLLFLAKTILYLVLFVILIAGGYFVYLKIKDPDLSFAELFEQELQRLSGLSKSSAPPPPSPQASNPSPFAAATQPIAEATVIEEKTPAPFPADDAPLPPWLRPEASPDTTPAASATEEKAEGVPPASPFAETPPAPETPQPPAPSAPAPAAPPAASATLPDWLREPASVPAPSPISPSGPTETPPAQSAPVETPVSPPAPAASSLPETPAPPAQPAPAPAPSAPAPAAPPPPPTPAARPVSPFAVPEPASVPVSDPAAAPAANGMPFPPPLAGEAELPLKPEPEEE